MMETQAVFEQFALLTGLGEQEAGKYRPLCENARAQVMGIAKPDIYIRCRLTGYSFNL